MGRACGRALEGIPLGRRSGGLGITQAATLGPHLGRVLVGSPGEQGARHKGAVAACRVCQHGHTCFPLRVLARTPADGLPGSSSRAFPSLCFCPAGFGGQCCSLIHTKFRCGPPLSGPQFPICRDLRGPLALPKMPETAV